MDPTENPYNPGAGTPPPELAGREDILLLAEHTIARTRKGKAARHMIMLGLRGVGKTVLINRIDQIADDARCHTAFFEADPTRRLPEILTRQLHRLLLRLDRSRQVSSEVQKAFALLRSFARAFKVQYGEFEVGLSGEPATGDLALDLSDLFEALGRASRSRETVAVLLIDELQYVNQQDLSALIMALHKTAQRQLPLVFFGAGLPQLSRLVGDARSYAERLFDYQHIDRLDTTSAQVALVEPARREGVVFDDEALKIILQQTDCHPFFLQVWGSHAWEIAPASPITAEDAHAATSRAITALDNGFFKVRLERLTDRQQEYARAMAVAGTLPATSTAVARELGLTVKQAAPIRDEVIKKGMAYSPRRGLVAFTVPKFDEFVRRTLR